MSCKQTIYCSQFLSKSIRKSIYRSPRLVFSYTTPSRTMAAPPTQASQVISETAKAEGGPEKGSLSAQMQSQVETTRNFEEAAQDVGGKMQNDPAAVSSEVGSLQFTIDKRFESS